MKRTCTGLDINFQSLIWREVGRQLLINLLPHFFSIYLLTACFKIEFLSYDFFKSSEKQLWNSLVNPLFSGELSWVRTFFLS